MIDYTIFYKTRYSSAQLAQENSSWDLFLSSFDKSERVNALYDRVNAGEKKWLINSLYNLQRSDYPSGNCFELNGVDEAKFINSLFDSLSYDLSQINICVDITGFLKPELLYLFNFLTRKGVKRVDVLYSEPSRYPSDHDTSFTNKTPLEIRGIRGYEGADNQSTDQDTLIVGVGYDDDLFERIAQHKSAPNKAAIIGFPSLQPDMYQQSRIRARSVAEIENFEPMYFAPANDPFVTASVLQRIVSKVVADKARITNLYLSPLGTKPQALGFALYYLYEGKDLSSSIIYPFTSESLPGRSEGISKVWKYCVELPTI